ncbi:hypothetical protein FisN_7Lh023 [Fistulifera solaris]|uniref:SSD domain-containing protein n=1 Tax=Fistulifera solaris TaxID=1519565 RepID=A0A1Z5JCP2_FISSO|nr:hypothetical protein FisN_7Lh023 [Fistulifera solaris]|eukprot:GAX11662.1 hypothetical protein FisN_7Lh023 [Fistulifera solaris]
MSENQKDKSLAQKWEDVVKNARRPIMTSLRVVSGASARNPIRTIVAVIVLSLGVFVLGLFTNFEVEVDGEALWTPQSSKPIQHSKWIDNVSGFPREPRPFVMFFHQRGGNVIGQDQIDRVFQALDAVRSLPKYNEVCADTIGSKKCEVHGIVDFFNESAIVFQEQVSSDADAVAALSALVYSDGRPVSENDIMGKPVRDASGQLVSAESFTIQIDLPDTSEAEDFEEDALDVILELSDEWEGGSSTALRLEVQAERSFDDEFGRAIVADIPLVPAIFIIMSIFCCVAFAQRNWVYSQSLVGFGAVVSVMLSLLCGFGFMFVCEVPFTSMTQILPFIIFGIGLDDAFIISGAFSRSDKSKTPVDRILDTMDDIGMSIVLTTLTSTLAFGLGCLSSVPAVFWLCLYACFTIFIVLMFQLTFFVGCIVVDEKRIADRRRDCLVCFKARDDQCESDGEHNDLEDFATELMGRYAECLMKPVVKGVVIVGFTALAIASAFSASKLKQEFKFTEVVPNDSYVADFFNAYNERSVRSSVSPAVYFRGVDQSDPVIQDQMERYIEELVSIDAIETGPDFFWLRDFKFFAAEDSVTGLTFSQQLELFLQDPVYRELYADHIVLDETGNIRESRCSINMDNVDIENVKEQIDALESQRDVTSSQPINQGSDDWFFFTYDGVYDIWEFYSVSVNELILTTITGVVAVTGIALLLIPHWSAAVFILPLVCVLYVELLGWLQWFGKAVNPVSYVTLVMSIGLTVDYIVHVLVRYYEAKGSRSQKVTETLRTMGASILIGAASTFLGILPLAFSTSEIFGTVFVAFLGLVLLGATHGLILLPVVLSMFGPENVKSTSISPGKDEELSITTSH